MPKSLNQFLFEAGLDAYLSVLEAARIDMDILSELTELDLINLGIPLGDSKRFIKAIHVQESAPKVVERRLMSILFVDLKGSTEMSVRMDLEDYHRAMFSYQKVVEKILHENGGHLAQKFGDGVMAYFGFPICTESDTQRAARAALEISQSVSKIEMFDNSRLYTRVGLATGLTLVEQKDSSHNAANSQVFGETANLAARLQSIAKTGEILVCRRTMHILEGKFILKDFGAHALKGLTGLVPTWTLQDNIIANSRFDTQDFEETNTMVNCKTEISAIKNAWKKASGGSGLTTMVKGCAGIGKSNLILHFLGQAKQEPCESILWQCDLDQQGRPLHPIAAQIEQEIHVLETQKKLDRDQAIKVWIEINCPNNPRADELISAILMDDEMAVSSLELDGSEIRIEMFSLIASIIKRAQNIQPVILVTEDLHWADPTTLALLDYLAPMLSDLRVMLLCSQRNDAHDMLQESENLIFVNMKPLNDEAAAGILEHQLGNELENSGISASIIKKCEGVPLYLEEMARAVTEKYTQDVRLPTNTLELSVITQTGKMELPASLLGPLLSRLDSREGARELTSIAAAIGRRFSFNMLEALMEGVPLPVKDLLDDLVKAKIKKKVTGRRRESYEFSHAMMRDSAYSDLLKERRLDIHHKIAEISQTAPNGTQEAHPAKIAYHYAAAEEWDSARHFWIEAACEMQRFSAHREAVEYCKNALDANKKVSKSNVVLEHEIEIRELMFTSLEETIWWSEEYAKNLQHIQNLRKERGDNTELISVLNGLAGHHLLLGNVKEAVVSGQRMMKINRMPVNIPLIMGHRILGICQFLMGEFNIAKDHFETCGTLAAKESETILRQYYNANIPLVSEVFTIWAKTCLDIDQDFSKDITVVKARISQSDDYMSQLYGLCILGCVFQTLNKPEECYKISKQAIALAEKKKQTYWYSWSMILLGWSQTKLRKPDHGIEIIEQGISEYIKTGARQFIPYARVLECDAYLDLGKLDKAAKLLDDLITSSDQHEIRFVNPMIAKLKSRIEQAN